MTIWRDVLFELVLGSKLLIILRALVWFDSYVHFQHVSFEILLDSKLLVTLRALVCFNS